MESKERLIGPDIIRSAAIIFVICGHFFLNTEFNSTPFVGTGMFAQGVIKSFCNNIEISLFIMLSGYFCCTKKLTRHYYRGLMKIIATYVFISLITWAVLDRDRSVLGLLLGITGFSTIGYAWYVNMYIGLFLLIPFINIVLEKMFQCKRHALALIATLMVLCSLPPMLCRGSYHLVPDFWQICFPLMFYCAGAYIRSFQPIVKHKACAWLTIITIALINPVVSVIVNKYEIRGGVIC